MEMTNLSGCPTTKGFLQLNLATGRRIMVGLLQVSGLWSKSGRSQALLKSLVLYDWQLGEHAWLMMCYKEKQMQIYSRCFMCDQDAESNNHLFLHCKIATKLWDMFLGILGIIWVMPKSTMELLKSWKGNGSSGSKENFGWMIIIWWTLWEERNTRCFERQE